MLIQLGLQKEIRMIESLQNMIINKKEIRMIESLQNMIINKKGDADLNLKIKELHRNEFNSLAPRVRVEHDSLIQKITDLEIGTNADLVKSKADLETSYPWLLDDLGVDEFGRALVIPKFSMSDLEVSAFRITNYSSLREAGYASENQQDLHGQDVISGTTTFLKDHILAVKARFPKE